MTKWINQIDDTVGIGSSIISQMREQGGEYGIGLSTNFECHNQVASGIVTATQFVSDSTVLPFYPPVMTTTQRDVMTVTQGAMIFNSTSKKMEFYDGTSWQTLPGMSLGLTVALDG